MSETQPLVLVVEDEPDLADLYATWLDGDYRVRTAYGGREALDALDAEVSVILLDRRMPDLPGDEVLSTVRERGIDCRVAMVTAVEPDFDIVAMGFDDYLVKPVSKDALRETVENLLLRDEYADGIQELFSLASKKALLESEKGPTDLEESDEYRELDERLSELRDDLDSTIESLGDESGMTDLYRDLDRDMGDVTDDGDGNDDA
ncbi:MAG: HalX domain-containing protein [Haloferacaceae archaeon]